MRTPALDEPLVGSIYIGEPQPGNQYRLFMLFEGFGINAKLSADVHPDPATGQLTVTMIDLPQAPFESFNLHLFASDRGLVATPTQCTLYNASSDLVPWNSALAPQHSSPFVTITDGPNGRPCPGQVRPFNPRLIAGTSNPLAGGYSDFSLKLDRDDGDQFLGDLNFRLPPGFTGSLRGINYCPDRTSRSPGRRPAAPSRSAPSCPASSAVGTTNVAAGPGEQPFHAVGRMYLAGPFKGAPLSLAAITPALAGPYDYGVVVVRVALHIDPRTAQVTAASDTVPSDHRRRPDPDALDPGEHRQAQLHDQPDQLLALHGRLAGDRRPGHGHRLLLLLPGGQLRPLNFGPKMRIRQLGGTGADRARREPEARASTSGPATATPT